jgi:hypothetical protein
MPDWEDKNPFLLSETIVFDNEQTSDEQTSHEQTSALFRAFYKRRYKASDKRITFNETTYRVTVALEIYWLQRRGDAKEYIDKCVEFGDALWDEMLRIESPPEYEEGRLRLPIYRITIGGKIYNRAVINALSILGLTRHDPDLVRLYIYLGEFAYNIFENLVWQDNQEEGVVNTQQRSQSKEQEQSDIATERMPSFENWFLRNATREDIQKYKALIREREKQLDAEGIEKANPTVNYYQQKKDKYIYWYKQMTVNGKHSTVYVGKTLPEELEPFATVTPYKGEK